MPGLADGKKPDPDYLLGVGGTSKTDCVLCAAELPFLSLLLFRSSVWGLAVYIWIMPMNHIM